MPNSYYNQGNPIARFITADATRLNQELQAIQSGFDKLPSVAELNSGSRAYSVATGTTNSYAVTVPYPLTSYNSGLEIAVLIPAANTGASNISVNGLPAVQIRRFDGTVLQSGDLRTLSINKLTFDGANFRLTSPHGAAELLATTSATNAATSATNASASATQAANSALSASQSASTASGAASTATSALAAARFGLRNLLYNPLWWVSQRFGATGISSDSTVAAGVYFRDRWKAGPQGLTFRITSGSLNIISGSIQQIVQGRNIPFNSNYTLSWTGTASGAINGTNVANGGNISLTGYQHATVTFSGGTVYLPQLEWGTTKTSFELRPADIERSLCLQYYQKSYEDGTLPGTVTLIGSINSVAVTSLLMGQPTVSFQTPMRAAPTLTIYNPFFANMTASMQNIDDNAAYSFVIENLSDRSFSFYRNNVDYTPGHRFYFHWTADAEL